jgi:uncharacterized membrane protein YdjX (TVP38/TMEM64 family)
MGAAAAAWFAGDLLTFETLERNRAALEAWRDDNYLLAAVVFVAVYAASVAVSVPGAVWLTIGGGFLFGLIAGGLLTVVAATLGATAIFLAARTGLGDALRARAGGWLRKAEAQFQDNEVSFMLAMRLIPAVPFFVANLAPAFLGVRARTFVWTTFLGIMPGTFVFASIGAGLGEVFDRGETPDLGIIFDWPVLGPLLGLAALSLLPALFKRLRRAPKEAE